MSFPREAIIPNEINMKYWKNSVSIKYFSIIQSLMVGKGIFFFFLLFVMYLNMFERRNLLTSFFPLCLPAVSQRKRFSCSLYWSWCKTFWSWYTPPFPTMCVRVRKVDVIFLNLTVFWPRKVTRYESLLNSRKKLQRSKRAQNHESKENVNNIFFSHKREKN